MGGLCSRRSTVDNAPVGGFPHVNGHFARGSGLVFQTRQLPAKISTNSAPPAEDSADNAGMESREPFSFPEISTVRYGMNPADIDDGIPRLSRVLSNKSRSTKSKQAAVAKVTEVGSLLGRAGTAGFGKAVDVLDTLGSSMTNLNLGSGFTSGVTTKGNKISILSFEVANTIVKGANLMQSLSKENIRHLKEVVLKSEGVQNLISRDMDELLRIAAADKRLGSELTFEKQLKEEAETIMQQLMTYVHYTAELYHELHALDRFEQDYRRKLQEEDNSNPAQRGDSLAILRAELKSQNKHVKNLKKKSLWSRILEEVMEKLVDIVHFLHLEIHEAFGAADGDKPVKGSVSSHKKLGTAGLALHYANIITQIDTLTLRIEDALYYNLSDTPQEHSYIFSHIFYFHNAEVAIGMVSRSNSVPPNTRDSLYQGLPPTIKSALRSRLQSFQLKEELTVPQIKAEMEKTLQWLVPIATNTTKSEMNRKPAGQTNLLRIETLHHADKEKTEVYILDLVVWLHHLVTQVRAGNGGIRSPVKSPIRSPNQKTVQLSTQKQSPSSMLTVEDQEMLRDVSKRKKAPGLSKSQEFDTAKTKLIKHHRLSKSTSHSPTSESKKDPFLIRRLSSVPFIDFDINRIKALDVIDRVDTLRSL
ncbi:hypothetical protein GOBAR_DD28734 [Gossypium barbadense]|nr:hypothetical protein GOBAR_DD28734 [Gossypium barbadense]